MSVEEEIEELENETNSVHLQSLYDKNVKKSSNTSPKRFLLRSKSLNYKNNHNHNHKLLSTKEGIEKSTKNHTICIF